MLDSTPGDADLDAVPFEVAEAPWEGRKPLSECSLSGRRRGRPGRPRRERTPGLVSSNGSNSWLSWVLAADASTCRDRPLASVSRWYLESGFPRSAGLGPVSSPPLLARTDTEAVLAEGPVDYLLLGQCLGQFLEHGPVELLSHPSLLPLA